MTLIAHSISSKVPFVVGDILLSCKKVQKPFTPPTIFQDISEYLNEPDRKDFPCDLAQKVYIVTPNLIIALSGNVRSMAEFLKELKQYCKFYGNNIRKENIHTFLKEYDLETNLNNASFFMMLIEHLDSDSIYVSQFDYGNWNFTETEIYSEVYANGSGATSFGNWADEKVDFTTSHEKGDINYSIQSNICLIARLFGIERSSLATLKKNWGAGFEMAFYDGSTFVKFQQIAYLLFEANFDDSGNIGDPALTKVMYYKYVGETLVITSLDVLSANYLEKDGHLFISGQNMQIGTFPVFAIDLIAPPAEGEFAKDVSFLTYTVGAAYIIIKNQEKLFIPSFFNNGPEIKVELVLNKSFEVTMRLEIIADIKKAAKKTYPNV